MSKASKKRNCPAAGREITPAECGEHRGSRYQCPADCPHNPFAPANYHQLLEIERVADEKYFRWLLDEAADRPVLERQIQKAQGNRSGHALHALLVWRFLFQRDANGLTSAQRWERAGFPGLKNDHRVLVRARMQMRIVLFEVHRVLDAECTEAVDLLSPNQESFLIRDRAFAASALRFSTGLAWGYQFLHFWRLSGTAIILADLPPFEPLEIVAEIVRHWGGPADETGMRRWLAEHFVQFDDALHAVALERRRLMFESVDASFGKAVYELRRPFADCRDLLDEASDVASDELADGERSEGFAEARVWFANEKDAQVAPAMPGQPVLGRVLLGQAHWRLQAMGAARLAELRKRFETLLGDRVQFKGERLDNLAARLAENDPKPAAELVPPRLRELPQKILFSTSRLMQGPSRATLAQTQQEFLAAQSRAWLDEPIPALTGRTPREAAQIPELRRQLIHLMKSQIRSCDEKNLETGSTDDLNWMLRELGLNEILFPPPPRRAPTGARPGEAPGEQDFEEHEEDEQMARVAVRSDLPPAPPLPSRPFTSEEIHARLSASGESLEHPEDALTDMAASGSNLIDEVGQATKGLLDDNSFPFVVPFLVQIWYVFVPKGTRGPRVNRDDLLERIRTELEGLMRILKSDSREQLRNFVQSGAQPALLGPLAGMLLEGYNELPKKIRPDMNSQAIMLVVLRAVVEEMDRVCRAL